jgi:hypothetical protein
MALTLSTHTLGSHISVTGRSEAPRNRRATSIGWCPADLPRRGMTTFSSAAGLALAKHFPDAEDARSRRPPSGWGARRRRCQRTPGTHRGRRRGRSGRATRGCRGCWRERWIARSRTGGVEAVAAARRSSSISRSIAPASASARRPGASRTISVASVPARSSSPCAIAAQAPSSAPGESDLHSAHRDAARRPRRDERTLTDGKPEANGRETLPQQVGCSCIARALGRGRDEVRLRCSADSASARPTGEWAKEGPEVRL